MLKNPYRAVNLLFLLVLSLQTANAVFMWLPQYVRLSLNQALFVFLPAYLFLRLTRQPVKKRVRWNWPGWKIAFTAMVIGMGLYPLSAASAAVLTQVLGYTFLPVPPDVIPTTLLMSLLAVFAYAVMAPLCEEFLFRGVIQPVYEQRSGLWAVLFTGLLFIIFHLSLLQGLSIVLLALILGFVYHRTKSLQASILTHFGANFLAAVVITEGVFLTRAQAILFTPGVIAGGAVASLFALAVLIRLTRTRDTTERKEGFLQEAVSYHPARAASFWPILPAAAIFFTLIGLEFITARSPEKLLPPLSLSPVPAAEVQHWSYQVRNIVDDYVGEGECSLRSTDTHASLVCSAQMQAYEVTIGRSYFASSGGTQEEHIQWRLQDGQAVSGSTSINIPHMEYDYSLEWLYEVDGLEIKVFERGEEKDMSLDLDDTPLASDSSQLLVTNFTWPWQLSGMTFKQGEAGRAVYFRAHTWRPETQDSGPVARRTVIAVVGQEDVQTPAGTFRTWKVSLDDAQTAWYSMENPQMVVKMFNGSETWYLKD
jgi:membrane protease YdiL (CAAX protease family)